MSQIKKKKKSFFRITKQLYALLETGGGYKSNKQTKQHRIYNKKGAERTLQNPVSTQSHDSYMQARNVLKLFVPSSKRSLRKTECCVHPIDPLFLLKAHILLCYDRKRAYVKINYYFPLWDLRTCFKGHALT